MIDSKDTAQTVASVEIEHLSEKTTTILMLGAIAAVLALLAGLYALAHAFTPGLVGADRQQAEQQVVQRLRPIAGFEMSAAALGPQSGEQVYNGLCVGCHGTGASGSPKFGDAAAWGARNAQGFETLLKHAIEGYTGKSGVMPARGGGTNSDLEVARAVVYMANKGGASFPEPKDEAAKDGAKDAKATAEPKKP